VVIIGEVAFSVLNSIVVQACCLHDVAVGNWITAANVVVREGARRARFNASEGVSIRGDEPASTITHGVVFLPR